MATYPLIQARHFNVASRTKIDLIVLHTMEVPRVPGTAERVARWFAGADAPQSSAHYTVDAEKVFQCVLDKDIAWHAPGANETGIGIEHAGFAAQTVEQWQEASALEMLKLSAALVAALCAKYAIPIVLVDAAGVTAKQRGITTHKAITDALNHGKGHWDPGPNFPMAEYIDLVQAASAPPAPGDVA